MPASAERLFAWHARPGAFERLTAPWQPVEVVERSGGSTTIADGARVTLRVPVGPVTTRWTVEHRDVVEGRQFRDVQLAGPFARWAHTHSTEPAPDGTSVLDDDIAYALPLPPFGDLFGGWLASRELERLFTYRHTVTANDLRRHERVADRGALRIAITGATGFLGRALVPFLTTGGHTVLRISRSADADERDVVRWHPERGQLDPADLEGVDAVIHLAGENVAQRWDADTRRRILESRTRGTALLARTLAQLDRPPRVLLSASGVNAYGNTGDVEVDESSPPGTGFLAEVVAAWEEAADPARAAGIRVVHPRMGVVLGADGGALAKLLPPFQLGLGGKVASGEQWMSWVARDDVLGALHFLLFADDVAGPVNVVAPHPVRNAAFTSTLADVLGRPAFTTVPAFALRAVYGQMAEETLLGGQRVVPRRLLAAGFEFLHPTLADALRFELGR